MSDRSSGAALPSVLKREIQQLEGTLNTLKALRVGNKEEIARAVQERARSREAAAAEIAAAAQRVHEVEAKMGRAKDECRMLQRALDSRLGHNPSSTTSTGSDLRRQEEEDQRFGGSVGPRNSAPRPPRTEEAMDGEHIEQQQLFHQTHELLFLKNVGYGMDAAADRSGRHTCSGGEKQVWQMPE